MPAPIRRAAPAKINLGLHVLRRRPDGYHEVETVLVPIQWGDEISVARAENGPSLVCDDPRLPTDDRNLVIRAALALAVHAGVEPAVAATLAKRVPYGAGLGGGSSDAAATLLALRDLWRLETSDDALRRVAAGLGTDVPFFVGSGAAFATGRGDVLEPLDDAAGSPWRMPFALVVAVPPLHVQTADAYALVRPTEAGRPDLRASVLSNDPARWTKEIVNDFQGPVAARHGEVARALTVLGGAGAAYRSLSGSGSGVYGVFADDAGAVEAARELESAGCATFVQPAPSREGAFPAPPQVNHRPLRD